MSYTPPDPRMAYDVDGTKVFFIDMPAAQITELSSQKISQLNDHEIGNVQSLGTGDYLVFAFPELRDLSGIFWTSSISSTGSTQGYIERVEASTDTTTLLDGTWTVVHTNTKGNDDTSVNDVFQTRIRELEAQGVRALRIRGVSASYVPALREVHLYGKRSAGQEVDHLELWHPTEDAPTPTGYFDWGDTPRGSTGIKQFRVKNSGARTATGVTVSKSALGTHTTILGQHKFGYGTASPSDTVLLGDMPPGTVSAPITLSYALPEDAPLGQQMIRVHAVPAGWA